MYIQNKEFRVLQILCIAGCLTAGCQTAKQESPGETSKLQTHQPSMKDIHTEYHEYSLLPTYNKNANPVEIMYHLEGENPLDRITSNERVEIESILRRVSMLKNPCVVRRVNLAWSTSPSAIFFDIDDGSFRTIRIVIVKVGPTWVFSNSSICLI